MASLAHLASDTERLFRIPCVFECEAPISIENPSAANHLYRIIQEALHNAVKHSQATHLAIAVQPQVEALCIAVRDNGIGIPEHRASPIPTSPNSSGLGMHTMSYRARIIGATLEFRRNPEGGTSVVCTLPAGQVSV